jgi:hypothetical protein
MTTTHTADELRYAATHLKSFGCPSNAEMRNAWIAMLRAGADAMERVKVLEEGIRDVAELIDNSAGVYGLHLNGEPSPWVSLMTGGRDEEWLLKFNKARAALGEKP